MQSHHFGYVFYVNSFIIFSPRHGDACSFVSGISGDEKQIHSTSVLFVFSSSFFCCCCIFDCQNFCCCCCFFFLVWAAAAINKADTVKKMKRARICMKQTKLKTKLILCPNLCTKKFILESNERTMHQKRTHHTHTHIGRGTLIYHWLSAFFFRWRSLILNLCPSVFLFYL